MQEISSKQFAVADAPASLAVLATQMEESNVIKKAMVEKRGIRLIKPEVATTSPVLIIKSNNKFKIQPAKANLPADKISKTILADLLKKAPKEEVALEGGMSFSEATNKGSGAVISGPLVALVTYASEKTKSNLGDYRLVRMRDINNSENVIFLNGSKADMMVDKFGIYKIEEFKNSKAKR